MRTAARKEQIKGWENLCAPHGHNLLHSANQTKKSDDSSSLLSKHVFKKGASSRLKAEKEQMRKTAVLEKSLDLIAFLGSWKKIFEKLGVQFL